MRTFLFTSESVTKGHPDKVCDLISDTVLDAYLSKDPDARVAVETMVKSNTVLLAGEISSFAKIDIEAVVRKTIKSIGYDGDALIFSGDTAEIILRIDRQSPDIAQGVDRALETRAAFDEAELGAGDQGMVFGYASTETPELMPLPISLAHRLAKRLTEVRENETLPYLRPDGKTQVSVRYEDGDPAGVETIVISAQHDAEIPQETVREDIIRHVVEPVIPKGLLSEKTQIYVNPTGRFVIGGPAADSGLTGRKIIVDTYGGAARHGGGAFSGKDPTKVDRSAAYAARYAAKNIVAAGLAKKCEIQIAYAIGVAEPVSVSVDTFGTGTVSDEALKNAVTALLDLRPGAMIQTLRLRQPIYAATAAYGHFGREDLDVPWERTDLKEKLIEYFFKEPDAMKMIASFRINHDVLDKGMYVSRIDGDAITYDIRMKKPNAGVYLANGALHTLEHLFATYLRNSAFADKVLYVGPMGCRTGFYLLLRDTISRSDALRLVKDAFAFVARFEGKIPGSERQECGNYREHDLKGAKDVALDMLSVLSGWTKERMKYEA